MKVGIYSNNLEVNKTLVTMCANQGYKFKKILRYDSLSFKTMDMVIIDLDNSQDSKGLLEQDIPSMPEVVFVGISSNDEKLDRLRAIMNVERKPFTNKLLKHYGEFVKSRLESQVTITKDNDRIYDEFGLNLAEAFETADIGTNERLNVLRTAVSSQTKYEKQDDFLNKISLGDIEYREPKKLKFQTFDLATEIKNDAIVKYRIRKLKLMNISNKDIDDKINELINKNITISTNRPKLSSGEKDILNKLRNNGANAGSSFKERKKALEQQKQLEPPVVKAPEKIIEKPKEEEIPIIAPPILNKPLISNGPPIKPEFQRPMMGLKEEKEVPKLEMEKPKVIPPGPPLKTDKKEVPKVETPKTPQPVREEGPPVKKEKPVQETANKPEVRRPTPQHQEDDALAKFREKKRIEAERRAEEAARAALAATQKMTTGKSSNRVNKTIITNIDDETDIEDNSDIIAGGSSLVDTMKDRVGYLSVHAKPKTESVFEIANKKSKPPRR